MEQMNANEFVACWKNERDRFLATYLNEAQETTVSTKIARLNLAADQLPIMRDVVDGILTDAFYTLLLGLDGAASIGGVQQAYQIRDEGSNLISDPGELEAEAWEQFYGDAA